ncbi:hypothetical protein F6Q06_23250 [Pectobacterium parmentieri]|uniref:Lysogenic conversion protein n=2 Tax=Pectobacterium parmentieri TaxID=1905730 RepID=A0A0H3I0H7_PECPM|nr:hypothetical protein [Pectobacterium parmentieri]AFI89557.1 putative lysogenic conversion protein [Pectobacterium parmentieri]MBI0557366.1 hypothetical protein [Pectobacterium parmentieri]
MSNGASSFSSQLLIAIIPIFLGSFLFAGVLESYKKDQGLQKELIKDYYRPMRELQGFCSTSHNELFLKYGDLAGSYQLMFDEIVHMFETPESKLGRDYEAIPMSVVKANSELKKRVEELDVVVKKCRSDLFLKYEELALATGSYPELMRLAEKRTNEINAIYSERKKKAEEIIKDIDPNQLMPLMRRFVSIDMSNDMNKSMLISEMKKIFEPAKQYDLIMAESEQSIFQKEYEFFQKLHELFAKEISKKHSGGFFSWMF